MRKNLFWNILFIDALFLFFRYGGLEVIDFLIHSCMLGIATCVLYWRKPRAIPSRLYLIPFAVGLVLMLIQLIPLSESLFPLLAPIKHRVMEGMTGIYPQITTTTQITFIPELHLFKLAVLTIDLYMILLMLMAPPPSFRLIRGWVCVFALTAAFLSFSSNEASQIAYLFETFSIYFGELVNPNHRAYFLAVLITILSQFTLLYVIRIKRIRRRGSGSETEATLAHTIKILTFVFCIVFAALAFFTIWSRSGLLNLVIAHGFFIALLLFNTRRFQTFQKLKWASVALLCLPILFLIPLGESYHKFEEEGFTDANRVAYLKMGFDYLGELPVLGSGLGSTESILEPIEKKNPYDTGNLRHLHNELIQVTLEIGILGLICLLAFFYKTGHDLLSEVEKESSDIRYFAIVAFSLMIMTILYSQLAFPIRVTSIRAFVLIIIFSAIAFRRGSRRGENHRSSLLAMTPIWLAVTAFFAFYLVKTPNIGMELENVQRAERYGYFYRIPFFVANAEVGRMLVEPMAEEELHAKITECRSLLYDHLKRQPYAVKALNLLFILDVIEERLQFPQFDRERFDAKKAKAFQIRELTNDANFNARSAIWFLYSFYEPDLNEEEKTYLEELNYSIRYRIRDQKWERDRPAAPPQQ